MIDFMALSGFLGAGKTTTLVATAKYLQDAGRRVAIITNDQGTELVDTQIAQSGIDEVGEVTGGCFCCRFDDLLAVAQNLIDNHSIDTLLAEAVGSCTDLQATVVRPMRRYYGDRFSASPLVAIVEPERLNAINAGSTENGDSDMAYLFGKQLEEADIIALNKIDLLDAEATSQILADLQKKYPAAAVLGYSAKSGAGLEQLVHAWTSSPPPGRNVEVDYDRYANAEAALAWLNQTLTVTASKGFDANTWGRTLLEHLSNAADRQGWVTGHAKVSLQAPHAFAKFSLTASGAAPTADMHASALLTEAEVRINARVACEPAELDDAVLAAVNAATTTTSAEARKHPGVQSFKPGYPQPVYRLAAPGDAACACGGECN